MHSTSKATWPDSTSAAERGSVISGSGRAQAARPPTASGRSITGHSVSPSRTGRGPFTQPQPADMARWAGAKPRWGVSCRSWGVSGRSWPSRAAVRGDGPQGGGGADGGAIGDDGNAAGRPPVDAQQAEDLWDMPWAPSVAHPAAQAGSPRDTPSDPGRSHGRGAGRPAVSGTGRAPASP